MLSTGYQPKNIDKAKIKPPKGGTGESNIGMVSAKEFEKILTDISKKLYNAGINL